ncbi:two-component sensor histidine kinase, partial [Achromobacter xylosoxidans]
MHGIAELPYYIRLADRLLLPNERQDLVDLPINAKNAVERGGSVSCTVTGTADRLSVEIANSGQHIPHD